MTDREMLELAARAMGYPVMPDPTIPSGLHVFYLDGKQWNPLTDDGDALRLMVKLSISFSDDYLYPNGEHVVRVGCVYGDTLYGDQVVCGNDPLATTRRAIVMAAAEIGRSMK